MMATRNPKVKPAKKKPSDLTAKSKESTSSKEKGNAVQKAVKTDLYPSIAFSLFSVAVHVTSL